MTRTISTLFFAVLLSHTSFAATAVRHVMPADDLVAVETLVQPSTQPSVVDYLNGLNSLNQEGEPSELAVPTPAQICTRDFNPWGHASHCSCPSDATYERRLGQCLTGESKAVAVEGTVQTGVMAIGGETTGFVLTTNAYTYELVLSFEQQEMVNAMESAGVSYQVTGDVVVLPGIEFAERTLLLVDTIEAVSNLPKE